MNKKQQTLNPEAAVEMVIKMQDRQTNAIEILSGLILQFEQINYVLHKIDEATCETGKGVDDAWNMLKNREGIWQGANIVQTYMSSFEKNAEESYLYHFFSVMLRTGMRKGEMQGLKYSDIDKKQNVIHVRRTLKYIEGKGYFEDTPKTRTSTRDIPLTAAITEHIEAQRKYWGFKVVRMDQYLFCNENGDPISRERIQGEIDRIIKRIKSDGYDFPRITSHVFRHTFATRAIEAGMPPQVLKTILGHSSLAMTMDLYSHVLPDTKADEMQKIANVF